MMDCVRYVAQNFKMKFANPVRSYKERAWVKALCSNVGKKKLMML